jgi:coenzyme F420-reducing hydrogenase delta subunit
MEENSTVENNINNNNNNNNSFSPTIIGFLCNWCSYAGADLAGVSRLQYPPNVRVIRVMCSGRLDPAIVLEMLIQGADGVFIGGCHLGDCHYIKGNYYAEKRYNMTKRLLAKTGLNPERLQLKWISASEGQLFADTMKEVTDLITELGPSPVTGSKPDLNILEQLLIIRNAAEDYRLRVLIGKGITLVDDYNIYNEKLDGDRFQALLESAIEEEYIRSGILFHTREEPRSVVYIAEKINTPPQLVLQHIVTLKDRDLLRMERIDGDTPYYISQVHNPIEEPIVPSIETEPPLILKPDLPPELQPEPSPSSSQPPPPEQHPNPAPESEHGGD